MYFFGVGFEIRQEKNKMLMLSVDDVTSYDVLWDDDKLLVNDIKFLHKDKYKTF